MKRLILKAAMNDEDAFLKAISANTADLGLRQVYADWLEERGDQRAEFVRLQVQIAAAPNDAYNLQKRVDALRAQVPPYWAALLDPPVWCIVGNIVDQHAHGPGGAELRRGTRLFRPSAKVYLGGMLHCYAVLNPDPVSSLKVVGQHRKSRQWILSWVRSDYVGNWRVRLVHHPGAMVRLREAAWHGFRLGANAEFSPEEQETPEGVRALLEVLWALR